MAYIDGMLASGERPVRRDHQHWFVLLADARWGILAIVAAILLLILRGAAKTSGGVDQAIGIVVLALVLGGLLYIGWQVLRYLNEEYIVTTRRVLQARGRRQQEGPRQLAREDQRRRADPVALRPDLRFRRSRHPHRVRERDLAPSDAPPGRRLQAGDARSQARARAGALRRQAAAVAAAAGRWTRRCAGFGRRRCSFRSGRSSAGVADRDVGRRAHADAGQPRGPAGSRRDQRRGVRGEEGGPARATLGTSPPPREPRGYD